MIVQEFIDELSRRLRDVNKKQWDDGFLTSATNAALGALATSMPQVFTVNRNLTLVAGTEQEIPQDMHKIVTLLHNVSNVDGTPRRAVTKADMSVFDAAYPQWRQDPPRSYIRHWMMDEFDESKFYVWPPAVTPVEDEVSAQVVRGTFTKVPQIVDVEGGVIESPGDPPVEPANPGPVASGLPEGVAQFPLVLRTAGAITTSSGSTVDIRIEPPERSVGGKLLFIDYGSIAEALSAYSDDTVVHIVADDTSGAPAYVCNNAPFTESVFAADLDGLDPSFFNNKLKLLHIRHIVAQGTPVVAIQAQSVYTFSIASNAVASLDALPLYLQRISGGEIEVGDSSRKLSINPTAVIDGNTVSALTTEGGATATLMVSQIQTVPQYGLFVLYHANSGSTVGDLILLDDGTTRLVYAVEVSPFNSSLGDFADARFGTSSTNSPLMFMARQATDTEHGLIIDAGRVGDSRNYLWPTSDLIEAYENRTTQAVVDAYLVALEDYVAQLPAYETAFANYVAFLAGEITTVLSEMPVKLAHIPALQEFAMYYAYSIDDDLTANSGRAQRHWLAFFQLINKREDANLLIGQAREITE